MWKMHFSVSDHVTWVGKTDWELQTFHGEELSTFKGSTYNAYLIQDEKTALVDTVWTPFARQFVEDLKETIDLDEIDYVVALHAEPDHSGGLIELMREIPDVPIYCTSMAARFLRAQYHQDWNFVEVKTGDTLSLGKQELVFVEAKMLHWPDNLLAYLTGDQILFSSDAFGQHYSSEVLFNDLVDQGELYREALKYYANILTPFSKMVARKIDEVLEMELPLKMICPSHGVIWREDPAQIIETYARWADDYQEDQVAIVYDTMWDSTGRMAAMISDGIRAVDPTLTIKHLHTAKRDKNDIIAEVFRSKAILVGSSTVNRGVLSSISAILSLIEEMGFKKKKASAFGSYGWSGEAPGLIRETLEDAGFEILIPELREAWTPDAEGRDRCRTFGRDFARQL